MTGRNMSPPELRDRPTIPDTVDVVNGSVRTGDTVAAAVRDGNFAVLRYGVITEFGWIGRHSRQTPVMKLRITKATDFGIVVGKVIRIEGHTSTLTESGIIFDRVVKVAPDSEEAIV